VSKNNWYLDENLAFIVLMIQPRLINLTKRIHIVGGCLMIFLRYKNWYSMLFMQASEINFFDESLKCF
jgi:hypothetical protein